MILNMIASLFLIVAIICFLNLTPKTIADDLLTLTTPKESIREKAHALRTGKKKKSLGQRLIYTQDALQAIKRKIRMMLYIGFVHAKRWRDILAVAKTLVKKI